MQWWVETGGKEEICSGTTPQPLQIEGEDLDITITHTGVQVSDPCYGTLYVPDRSGWLVVAQVKGKDFVLYDGIRLILHLSKHNLYFIG